ncbi:MAG: sugar O-acetyltransferase [Dehalococcoidales bacterium]|nr:sugar O-acetyltransferase [Dehalococcoidales bacterium]
MVNAKSEKEKMLAGELYLAADPQLRAERQRAHGLTRRFNATSAEETELREQLLRELFGALGQGAEIEPPFYCDYGYNITAGAGLYLNFGCVLLDGNCIEIGNSVLFGPYVQVYTAYHPTDPRLRLTGLELTAPIRIGSNVWVGGGAIIGPGVTIGDDSVIGAGSVVLKDVPAGMLAAGNPCRVIRPV